MAFPEVFWWGTGASSTQAEGAAPASDWYALEREGRVPPSGDGNGFGTRYAEDFALYAGHGLAHHRLEQGGLPHVRDRLRLGVARHLARQLPEPVHVVVVNPLVELLCRDGCHHSLLRGEVCARALGSRKRGHHLPRPLAPELLARQLGTLGHRLELCP